MRNHTRNRLFMIVTIAAMTGTMLLGSGCIRSRQSARILGPEEQGRLGSHTAGSTVYNQLVNESVAKLLARQPDTHIQDVSLDGRPLALKRVCFLGVENKGEEELGSFREDLYENIDSQVVGSNRFTTVSRRWVDAGLRKTGYRPDDLYDPAAQREFLAAMEQMGATFDYLMYATVTSTNTRTNSDYQRDYRLTLELVGLEAGDQPDKEFCRITKEYNRSTMAKVKNWFMPPTTQQY